MKIGAHHVHEAHRWEVRGMAEKFKKNKGNKFANQAEFASEVVAKNVKQEAQNNPKDRI